MNTSARRAMTIANELDAALARRDDPGVICRILRTMRVRPKDVFAAMLYAWRMFSADFRLCCSEKDRRLVFGLSNDAPSVIRDNYCRQIRGMKMVEDRRRALTMRGRVNISLNEPFPDGARHEVHDLFSRMNTADGYAQALALLPNLRANDIASTIWAGRIYQDDFFRAAPQQLRLKMLQHLHMVSPAIAQTFAAQLLRDRELPRRYRVLAWAEGVLRPWLEYLSTNADVEAACAASREARRHHVFVNGRRAANGPRLSGPVYGWLSRYAGGDAPARFDLERTLHGFKLSRLIVNWLCEARHLNVLTYYLRERRTEFERVCSLREFAGHVCAAAKCSDAVYLLGIVEELSPGLVADCRDANGANLLEHVLYRYCGEDPVGETWVRMCLKRRPELRTLTTFLRQMGCRDDVQNSVGITWGDIEDAARQKFDRQD